MLEPLSPQQLAVWSRMTPAQRLELLDVLAKGALATIAGFHQAAEFPRWRPGRVDWPVVWAGRNWVRCPSTLV